MSNAAVIFGLEGQRLTIAERHFFKDANPWGFILFARNIDNPAQLSALTAELRELVGWQVPILIDQEGGRVARMKPPHWREWCRPDLLVKALSGADLDEVMYIRHRLIAHELQEVGIDVDCLPMLDVAIDGADPIISTRAVGQDAAQVARHGRTIANALLDGGVLPVMKHMPGHGRALCDSHKELPIVDAPLATLDAVDFAPFKALRDLPMGMSAHLVLPAIDPLLPVTQSAKGVRMIRERIGFDGLLMTDDLGMNALSGGFDERAKAALTAGCDIILHCSGNLAEMQAVMRETPVLSGASARRAHAALAFRRPIVEIDVAQLDARHAELTHNM